LITKINKYFTYIFFINFFIIFSAFFIEYVLKVKPCSLCIYQRYPYYIILILCLLFFFKKNWKDQLIILIIFLSAISLFLASYHVAIEQGLIKELSSCQTNINDNLSKDILLKNLNSAKLNSCKEVNFKILGISLASINMLISLILTIFYYKIFIWIRKIA